MCVYNTKVQCSKFKVQGPEGVTMLNLEHGTLNGKLSPSERRHSHGSRGILDGNREADADEEALICRVQNGGNDANDLALCGHQRPAGAAGIDCGIELDEIR